MIDHDKERELFGKRYELTEPWPVVVAVAFNEGWLRGRKKLREQQLRNKQRMRKP